MSQRPPITLVTGRDMPGTDTETPLVKEALRSIGVESEVAAWRDSRDWRQSSLIVLRTPWDYVAHVGEFRTWATMAGQVSRLKNAPDVILWNLQKNYLLDLQRRDVAIVPTRLFRREQTNDASRAPSELKQQVHWTEVVVKPAVGINAGGSMWGRIDDPVIAKHLAALLRRGDALVQPFLPTITSEGELSLVFVDSIFTHAVRKRPKRGDYRVQNNHGGTVQPYEPTAKELAVASAALACSPSSTTYARVDLAYFEQDPVVMELELIEPELFLRFSPSATNALAHSLKSELSNSGRHPES
jgi:glutathione synthase/RimK-type ligase-like ATP-grasp enzyme